MPITIKCHDVRGTDPVWFSRVGGIISETSFKFFVQFVFYAALYCVFTAAFTAKFVVERTSAGEGVDTHWIIVLSW